MTCIINMKNFYINVYVYVYTYSWEGVMKTNKGTQERCPMCRYQGSGKEECIDWLLNVCLQSFYDSRFQKYPVFFMTP